MSRKKKPPQPPAPPLERALKSLREQVSESQRLAREHGASMSGFRISVDGDEAVALVAEVDRLVACKDLLREFVEVAKANEFLMDLSLLVRAQEALK